MRGVDVHVRVCSATYLVVSIFDERRTAALPLVRSTIEQVELEEVVAIDWTQEAVRDDAEAVSVVNE